MFCAIWYYLYKTSQRKDDFNVYLTHKKSSAVSQKNLKTWNISKMNGNQEKCLNVNKILQFLNFILVTRGLPTYCLSLLFHAIVTFRSSRFNVFLGKDVLKIYIKFTEERPCRSVISIHISRAAPVLSLLININ